MYVPALRDRVQVAGRHGVFLVVCIDREAGTADLLALSSGPQCPVIDHVPFELLRPRTEL
jgi:hypothetical protein